MRYELDANDAFPSVKINLNQGETIRIQPGSMVYRQGGATLKAGLNTAGKGGGLLGAIGRTITSGESLFLTEITSPQAPGTVVIAPPVPGKIVELEVGENQYCLNDGVFLAMDSSVQYNMVRQSLTRAFLGGQGGLFVMETSGQGKIIINAFGSIDSIYLDGSQEVTIDNGHVVAWDRNLEYNIHLEGGGFLGSIGTGEGLVNTFRGRGVVFLQTLNVQNMANYLRPFLNIPSGR